MDITAGQGNAGNGGRGIGTNGHSNAVIGGNGTVKNNIFTTALRGGPAAASGDGDAMDMGAFSENDRGLSYRGNSSFGFAYTPPIIWDTGDSNRAYAYEVFEWDNGGTTKIATGSVSMTTPAGTTAQTQYHTFNCGKCHNPHASRLPKLMITNCLDTNHNTWDDGYSTSSRGDLTNGTKASQWFTAQNCHRVSDHTGTGGGVEATQNERGAGWNKVTPW